MDANTEARLQEVWKRAYAARNQRDLRELYADWAESYDHDHDAIGFFGHVSAAAMLAKYVPFVEVAPVLDAGAGTGAAGAELHKLGFRNLTAVDLSDEMLAQAEKKEVYRHLAQGDLGLPLDVFPGSHFDAAVLVGVFSYGQAPAHALDEIVRVVKPGGIIAFTMRTDFYAANAMEVRSRIETLERENAWQLVELSDPQPYLPKKDPDAMFRVWCYRVLESKEPDVPTNFADAVRRAFTSTSKVKRLDHCHIWDSMASRLYNRYIECSDYYLVDCEEEILRTYATEIVGNERLFVELGCGSARKVRHLFDGALAGRPTTAFSYVPIDLSKGALAATKAEIERAYEGRVRVDPRRGHFDDVLPTIADDVAKILLFFGGSMGNIETLPDTVAFLTSLRERMTPRDRLIVGIDLHKDEAILRRAYEAGQSNRSFFLNMLRRINNELGANLDLTCFEQESTYDQGPSHRGVENRCVNLKLVTTKPQQVYISKLELETQLDGGDAIQVGTSRKFRTEDIARLAELAGMRLRRQWLDPRGYFSANEIVRDDAPE